MTTNRVLNEGRDNWRLEFPLWWKRKEKSAMKLQEIDAVYSWLLPHLLACPIRLQNGEMVLKQWMRHLYSKMVKGFLNYESGTSLAEWAKGFLKKEWGLSTAEWENGFKTMNEALLLQNGKRIFGFWTRHFSCRMGKKFFRQWMRPFYCRVGKCFLNVKWGSLIIEW